MVTLVSNPNLLGTISRPHSICCCISNNIHTQPEQSQCSNQHVNLEKNKKSGKNLKNNQKEFCYNYNRPTQSEQQQCSFVFVFVVVFVYVYVFVFVFLFDIRTRIKPDFASPEYCTL